MVQQLEAQAKKKIFKCELSFKKFRKYILSKKSKRTKKKLRLKPQLIYPSSECLHHYPIHEDGQKRKLWKRGSMELLVCYVRIAWIRNASMYILEELNTWSGAERITRKSS